MFNNNNYRFRSLCIWKVYLQPFLEECKYAKNSVKNNNYIDKELKLESVSDSDSDSDIYIEE